MTIYGAANVISSLLIGKMSARVGRYCSKTSIIKIANDIFI